MFKGFWVYLCSYSVQLWIDFFFPLFGGRRGEKTGKEDPVACFQVLKLLLLFSYLKIVPPYRLRFIREE